jgi:hypothetical protein
LIKALGQPLWCLIVANMGRVELRETPCGEPGGRRLGELILGLLVGLLGPPKGEGEWGRCGRAGDDGWEVMVSE